MKKMLRLGFAAAAFFVCWCLFSNDIEAAIPQIQASRQYFDVEKRLYILEDNVVIVHKNRRVTAGEAKTNLVEVWASGGVTFSQDDIRMSGSSVYANFPQRMVRIFGGVDFSRNDLRIQADTVEFNWKTKIAVFTNNVKVHKNDVTSAYEKITYNILTNTIW